MIYYSQALRHFPNADGDGEDIFLLIFYQNTFTNDVFKTESEFLETNSMYKYSVLKYINDDFKTDNVFEFILEYPEINQYGHWTQSKNPLEVEQDDDFNFQKINSTWINEISFIGLHKSSSPSSSYLEGTDYVDSAGNKCWYYAIGQKVSWNINLLAGPYYAEKGQNIHQVYLWLKITNLKLLKRIFRPPSIPYYSFHFDFTLFCLIIILTKS